MILVIQSQWNESIGSRLTEAAKELIEKSGFESKVIRVPGAMEIPLTILWALEHYQEKLQGVVACGVILRGETFHFELVARECTRALMDLSLQSKIPVGHGVLACENLEQAKARSQGPQNKGLEAAQAVLEMLQVSDALS